MTRERPHVSLWTRVLLIAILNLAILGIVCAIFLRLQLRPEFESFLMAQARERIASVTTLVTADLESTNPSRWDSVLGRYSKQYGITVLLYRNTGEQLAGLPTPLPTEVNIRMPRGGPPLPNNGAPPPFDPGPPPNSHQFAPPGPPGLAVTNSELKYWLGVRMPIFNGPDGKPLRSVLMFVSPNFFTNPFFFDLKPWLGIAAAAVFISVLCWLPFVRNLTRSIADMMRATARIAEGRFDVALKPQRYDELGRLGTSINQMAGRLEIFTEGRRRFLAAAAHELRSPLARMQLAAGILERNTEATAQKYIEDLKDDLAMMARLTGELLQSARAEATPERIEEPTRKLARCTYSSLILLV